MDRMRSFKKKRLTTVMFLGMVAVSCIPLAAGCGGSSSAKSEEAIRANVQKVLGQGIRPNEMGMVMVLEYHRLADSESSYVRSIENFKNDMETLYQKGFRVITFRDMMRGHFDVPAGKTPVVISFDDSTESQMRYLSRGDKAVLDPECALGIMEAFAKKHPDFGSTALFNVMPELFEQPKYKKRKLDYLLQNGYEIGNHTVTHPLLAKLSDEQVQKEIAGLQEIVEETAPGTRLDILCLPYGSEPMNKELMFKGSSGGTTYKNKWALLVGSNPFYPVYHYRNPGNVVPRVQVMDYNPNSGAGAEGSAYWFRYFERHPETLFVSDGDPATVCAPAYMQPRLLPDALPKGTTFIGY